ncbi:MAG: ECF transporter S component, partial [Gemmatimonadales bacterium]|nr:ECF transporter S component [Gemmatimonadales bacterium]
MHGTSPEYTHAHLSLERTPPTLSPRLLALIPSAVAINLAIGFIVNQLGLPLYLDTIGTVLTAALAGPLAGVITGLVSQAVRSLSEGYIWLPFGLVQVCIALLAAIVARRRGFRSVGTSLAWGVLVGLAAGALSAAISYFVFKGVTATGVTAVTLVLTRLGLTLPQAVTIASVGTDVIDKAIVFVLVGIALRALPLRVAARFG